MTVFFISHELTILVCIILGVGVYLTNPRRTANQAFLLLSAIMAGWLTWLALGFRATDAGWAKFCTKSCSCFGLFIPLGFNWLRASIKYPQKTLPAMILHAPVWLALAALSALVCTSDFYIRQFLLPAPADAATHSIPVPVYGPGVYWFTFFFAASFFTTIGLYLRDIRRLQGMPRTELQFTLLGGALGMLYAFIMVLAVPLVWHKEQIVQLAPLGVIVVDGVIAYGIATQRILEVALVLRRLVAYGLLTAYLAVIYLLAWLASAFVWRTFQLPGAESPHILAAVIVAFSMLPTHGLFQRFANRLFSNRASTNVALLLQQSGVLLQTVTTMDDLLQRFRHIVAEAVGTEAITLFVPETGRFVQTGPAVLGAPLLYESSAPLVRELAARDTPLVLDAAQRRRASPLRRAALAQLQQARASVAIGIKGQTSLSAILVLGPRLSGRTYSAVEQDTLQLLAGQLAAALENARLYTQVQDGKIYNDLLLDHLVNGVIAVNATGRVNVFNREAQRVTRLPQDAVLGQPFGCLPPPLSAALRDIWDKNQRVLDREIQLSPAPTAVSLRAGGAAFTGHAGARLGALLVFSDITDIKRLELQIRRSDRLATIGTLSAGMAHEIKNPLVALKTFAQLLPERYEDAEFRTSFSRLAQQEIERIDGIVNQLLEFSRPAKPLLAAASLHELLRGPLKLISEAAYKKQVTIETHCDAPDDTLLADSHQLPQALLNFLLNALDALADSGRLTLTTSIVEGRYNPAGAADAPPRPYLKLDIADTGCGIPPDTLPRIFDPFFTTKGSGTGLGLTVAHGIIAEHGGSVEVDSRVGQGTTFHLFFPQAAGVPTVGRASRVP